MNWHTLASTLVGALLTFSAILFTQALDIRKQRRAHQKLIHALLQGLHDEIAGLLELARSGAARPIEAAPDGKPYEGLFTASQDYFTVYHANAELVMQIGDAGLRRKIIQTYMRAKVLLDTVCMNRLYLERYHYLQSTFLKTRDSSVQKDAEEYRRTLIDTAAQLKRVDSDFKSSADGLVSMLSAGVASIVLVCTAGCKPESNTIAPPALVEVATVIRSNVPIYHEWIGTLDGLVNAQIRAQVTGYLQTQDYHEGNLVKRGDLLFEIDPRPFQATLDQAQGALAQAQARSGKTELDVKRYAPLVRDKAISQEEYDNAVQANIEAQAAVASAKALVEQARLNLEFTRVTSPIDGIPSIAKGQIGDLVGPGTGELATISTINPIKAYFNITEQAYVNFTRLFETESARSEQIKQLEAELIFPDGKAYSLKGRIEAVDRSVGLATGALRVEALFPNPNNALRPGQFARVRVKTDTKTNAALVPYRAVSELQGSCQVAVVDADNKIHIQPVRIGDRTGGQCIIEEGLESGQRVVVEGTQKISDGATVLATNFVSQSPMPQRSAR